MTEQKRNRIRCLKCNDIIESTYRHDYRSCSCGACFVDGGHDYQRMGGNFDDIRIVRDDDTEVPLFIKNGRLKDEDLTENPG